MANQPAKPKCGHSILVTQSCKECNKLFKLWNKKLDKAGHVEIEDFNAAGQPLVDWDSYRFKRIGQEVMESKKAYFEGCRNLLLSYKWDNETHKEIWRLHSEGLSVHEIADIIDKKKFKKSNIAYIVKHYKKELA